MAGKPLYGPPAPCIRAGCYRTDIHARGLCQKHYTEWWHLKHPERRKEYTAQRTNQEEHQEWVRQYRRTPEGQEKMAAASRRWYREHREYAIRQAVERKRRRRAASNTSTLTQ